MAVNERWLQGRVFDQPGSEFDSPQADGSTPVDLSQILLGFLQELVKEQNLENSQGTVLPLPVDPIKEAHAKELVERQ